MKKLLITVIMALSFSALSYEIKLQFKSKQQAEEWMIWYLDGGGEQFSEFYAETWEAQDLFTGHGIPPYLILKRDKTNTNKNTQHFH